MEIDGAMALSFFFISLLHQYFHKFLAGACASLYKLVQAP